MGQCPHKGRRSSGTTGLHAMAAAGCPVRNSCKWSPWSGGTPGRAWGVGPQGASTPAHAWRRCGQITPLHHPQQSQKMGYCSPMWDNFGHQAPFQAKPSLFTERKEGKEKGRNILRESIVRHRINFSNPPPQTPPPLGPPACAPPRPHRTRPALAFHYGT